MRQNEMPQTVFDRYDRIYIDASALMNNTALELFLGKYEDRIISSGIQIIIHESVQLELARFMTGNDPDKHHKAMGCLNVLERHPGLIVCGSSALPEALVDDAFADPDILAELLKGKRRFRQLLITNDGGLSLDALDLNRQHSCQGKPVSVKKISMNGDLKSFGEKKYLASLARKEEKTVCKARPKTEEHSPVQPEPVVHPAPEPAAPAEAASVTPATTYRSPAPAGVPYPVFLLGVIAAGIAGAFLGNIASPAPYAADPKTPMAA